MKPGVYGVLKSPVRMTVVVPEELKKRLIVLAYEQSTPEQRVTLGAVVRDFLEEKLAEEEKAYG